MNTGRRLIIIPIAHTYADMGSMRDKIPIDERYEAGVTRYWVEIFHHLRSMSPDFLAGLRIYQDGLVNAPTEIVDKIIGETQTANYEILRWLKEKGATVLGTEDCHLLVEEDQGLQAIVNSQNEGSKTAARLEYMKKSGWLLEERDHYIARRIKETLPDGATGLLFIGAAHDVGSLLSNEIQVTGLEIVNQALPEVLQNFYGLGKERK